MSIQVLRDISTAAKEQGIGLNNLYQIKVKEVEAALAEHDRLHADLMDLKRLAYERAPQIAAEEAGKQTAEMKEEIERLRQELGYIANAKISSFEDADDFRPWAQSRARHALNQQPGTLTIKK